ncbi:MAG: aldehyde dehydrogenase family protein [Vulcanimicrobiaceae bacterium]
MGTATAVRHFPLPIAGTMRATATREPVLNPYDGRVVATVGVADAADMEDAIAGARRAFEHFRHWSPYDRKCVLSRIAELLRERKASFVQTMIAESGKPRAFSEIEVERAVTTFGLAAEEATRLDGEFFTLAIAPGAAQTSALVSRFPIGVVGAIAPFNFPLNLVAHKLGPAFAVGNPVVLKPPPQAPVTALLLAEACYDAGIPRDVLSVVHAPVDVAQSLATDERVALLSFTGSAAVGWHLKSIAGKKRVVLELGGNAAAIVCRDADLAWAAKRCALGAFGQSGQVCISVQRVLVDETVFDAFLEAFKTETDALPAGDPDDPQTVLGPMIDAASASRVQSWIREALDSGARAIREGDVAGNVMGPFILTDTDASMKVECEEVFGPVASVASFRDFADAVTRANATRYGLQAGVFTRDLNIVRSAYRQLEVGGVIVNDYPTFRADNFPYGGSKDSGLGREGVRYAMHDMTELKTLVLSLR